MKTWLSWRRLRLAILPTLLVCSVAVVVPAHADETQSGTFSLHAWSPGLRLFAGLGANTSVLVSDRERVQAGLGATFRADAVYFASDDFAVEISTGLALNRVDGFIVWDTLLLAGVRARFPWLSFGPRSAPYMRLLAGYGPVVIDFEGRTPALFSESGAHRIQFEGPIASAGLGWMRQKVSGQVWFMELTLTSHFLTDAEVIKSEGTVPVILGELPSAGYSDLETLVFTVGWLAF